MGMAAITEDGKADDTEKDKGSNIAAIDDGGGIGKVVDNLDGTPQKGQNNKKHKTGDETNTTEGSSVGIGSAGSMLEPVREQ